MAILQLRSHIPIGSPARREPADGTESAMRVSLGFEPAWYHQRCRVDFSERWHTDPAYRFETRARMRAELLRRFPETDYWSRLTDADLASLSGCYGIGVIPRVFGFRLRYHAHRWPELEPGQVLSESQIDALDPDKLLAGPFVEELFTQMEAIERNFGVVSGYLNWQGVFNNAFHLRGQQIFLDIADNPALVERLLDVVSKTMIRLAQAVQAEQRQSGFEISELCVSNCTMNMLSPRMYSRFVLPYDTAIAAAFERFGVHTCNWNVTPYLKELAKLPKVGYLDMGVMSDLEQARQCFPEARRAVLYSPQKLLESSCAGLRSDMERIRRELAPCDIVFADLPLDTPDERVNEVLRICRSLE